MYTPSSQCVDPYAPVYVKGDPFDTHCSLDSDGDRFPDLFVSQPTYVFEITCVL